MSLHRGSGLKGCQSMSRGLSRSLMHTMGVRFITHSSLIACCLFVRLITCELKPQVGNNNVTERTISPANHRMTNDSEQVPSSVVSVEQVEVGNGTSTSRQQQDDRLPFNVDFVDQPDQFEVGQSFFMPTLKSPAEASSDSSSRSMSKNESSLRSQDRHHTKWSLAFNDSNTHDQFIRTTSFPRTLRSDTVNETSIVRQSTSGSPYIIFDDDEDEHQQQQHFTDVHYLDSESKHTHISSPSSSTIDNNTPTTNQSLQSSNSNAVANEELRLNQIKLELDKYIIEQEKLMRLLVGRRRQVAGSGDASKPQSQIVNGFTPSVIRGLVPANHIVRHPKHKYRSKLKNPIGNKFGAQKSQVDRHDSQQSGVRKSFTQHITRDIVPRANSANQLPPPSPPPPHATRASPWSTTIDTRLVKAPTIAGQASDIHLELDAAGRPFGYNKAGKFNLAPELPKINTLDLSDQWKQSFGSLSSTSDLVPSRFANEQQSTNDVLQEVEPNGEEDGEMDDDSAHRQLIIDSDEQPYINSAISRLAQSTHFDPYSHQLFADNSPPGSFSFKTSTKPHHYRHQYRHHYRAKPNGVLNTREKIANMPPAYRSNYYNHQATSRYPATPYDMEHPHTPTTALHSVRHHSRLKYDHDQEQDYSSSPSKKVIHIHTKEKKNGHGKYLWPILGGGLTMLMGFLIISNMLLSIPLLAMGASTLFGQNGYHTQQLVPVYNLSQLARPPVAGRRRKRRKRWALAGGHQMDEMAKAIGLRDFAFKNMMFRILASLARGNNRCRVATF